MDYKKIIKSRSVREKILRLLSFVPDKQMLQLQYFIKTGRKLNLKNPKRFTEKLQWYKLYYKNPLMIKCVDKYSVRGYVKKCGLGNILNRCYGVYDSPEDINFDELPEQFVIKDTLGGGGNSVIIVKDKNEFDIASAKIQMQNWINTPAHIRGGGREWPYYSGKEHRIIIENFLEEANEDLTDYKFFCFNGRVEFIYVISNRVLGNHGELAIMNRKWKRINVSATTQRVMKETPLRPLNYQKMIKYAEILSKGFPHVRVDLYNINGDITFGELTFFGASGYMEFEPDKFDYILGKKFILS